VSRTYYRGSRQQRVRDLSSRGWKNVLGLDSHREAVDYSEHAKAMPLEFKEK
jgi:hypothetical protein